MTNIIEDLRDTYKEKKRKGRWLGTNYKKSLQGSDILIIGIYQSTVFIFHTLYLALQIEDFILSSQMTDRSHLKF